MRALLCPASLKGVLSSASLLRQRWREVFARAGGEAVELPVADGGEGTADALPRALGGEWHEAVVSDPLGRPVPARWLVLPDGRAVSRRPRRSGCRSSPLRRARSARRLEPRARRARARGARASDPRALLVGLGGSATVDGGAGMREVLRELPVPTTVLCDVRTHARRRGASLRPAEGRVARGRCRCSSAGSRRWTSSRPYAGLPGAGAAGGLGAAFAALGAELVAGAPAILDLVGFDERARRRDLVVTGRGAGRSRRRRKARRREWSPSAAPRQAFAASSSAGRVVEPLEGAETVSLSGDPRARGGRPRGAGAPARRRGTVRVQPRGREAAPSGLSRNGNLALDRLFPFLIEE